MSPITIQHREQLMELCRRFRVKRLELFGSAARGDFDPQRSDLDFLVEFEPQPRGGFSDPYFQLLAALQDLFDRPVDLVELGAIRNPYLKQGIEESRTTLYAA